MNWKRLSRAFALAAAAIGALGFAGWVFEVDTLKRIHPAWVTMKANTALGLMLAGWAVALRSMENVGGFRRWVAQTCAVLIAVVGFFTLGEHLGWWPSWLDEALFSESLAEAGRSFPGRMNPPSAVNFMLLGAAVLLLDARTKRGAWPAQIGALGVFAITFLVFLGYFYGVEIPAGLKIYVSIALHTAIAFFLLAAALLLARPDRGFMAVFLAENIGGVIARRTLPAALLLPALLGWLVTLGRNAGHYGRGVGTALLAASLTVIFTGLVWWAARTLATADAARRAAVEALAQARDAAEAANRAKDDFLAVLSHELRTPLTPALAAASDLENDPPTDPAELREMVALIRRNIELEARLVDDLLDLTRIGHGKLRVASAPADVHAALRDALAIAGPMLREKNIALDCDLAAARHLVLGDTVRLTQVFANLLTNAAKFTPAAGRVTVRTANVNGAELRIAISDTGHGIEPAALPEIFGAFRQAEAGAARRFGGLGLGLSVAKGLVEAQGGTITAASAGRDQGAVFTVTLPALTATALAAAPAASAVTAPAAARALRVLLVEDHADTRAILGRLITRGGHTVTTAGSVAEARVALAAGEFDLLLSDLGLPDGTGVEVIAALRERSASPAVVMSGYGMAADLARTRAAGFAEHLVKPIDATTLRTLLTRFAAPPA